MFITFKVISYLKYISKPQLFQNKIMGNEAFKIKILKLQIQERPWFTDRANYKARNVIPEDYNWDQKKKFIR